MRRAPEPKGLGDEAMTETRRTKAGTVDQWGYSASKPNETARQLARAER
jgi:hypothetical protein